MGMVLAARKLTGKQMPAWEYMTRFDEEFDEADRWPPGELEVVNAFLNDLHADWAQRGGLTDKQWYALKQRLKNEKYRKLIGGCPE